MTTTAKDGAIRAKQQYLERLIGQAFQEHASADAIDRYLLTQDVKHPELIRARVEARKRLPSLGAQELTHLGGRDAFRALFGLSPEDHDAPVAGPDPTVEPMTLNEAHTVVRRWFGSGYDMDAFDAVLATRAGADLPGDPVWLLLLSGPGNTKTETVQCAGGRIVSTLSGEAALLSGTSKREQTKDATGGLLAEMGTSGVLIIKDVTSILSMHRESRASLLAALREIYDGRWTRTIGSDGGRTLSWTGRLIVIGAVTSAWDQAHEVIASMGDRFVVLRLDSTRGRMEAGEQTIRNTGHEATMRAELVQTVRRVLAGRLTTPIEMTDEEQRVLLIAANLTTLVRTSVIADYQGRILDAHAPEVPTRFAKQLAQIVRGGCAIGMTREQALTLACRVSRDSMPPMRLAILDVLARRGTCRSSTVRRVLDKPRSTIERQLQSLNMLGIVTAEEKREEGAQYPYWEYTLKPHFRQSLELIQKGTCSEMSSYALSHSIRERETETHVVCLPSDIPEQGERTDDLPF